MLLFHKKIIKLNNCLQTMQIKKVVLKIIEILEGKKEYSKNLYEYKDNQKLNLGGNVAEKIQFFNQQAKKVAQPLKKRESGWTIHLRKMAKVEYFSKMDEIVKSNHDVVSHLRNLLHKKESDNCLKVSELRTLFDFKKVHRVLAENKINYMGFAVIGFDPNKSRINK